MKKETTLQSITALAAEGILQKEEILDAFDAGYADTNIKARLSENKITTSDVLTLFGGGTVVLGMVIFMSQFWDVLNSATKILTTLGSGLLAFGLGVWLSQKDQHRMLSMAFHLIAVVALPFGLFTLIEELGVNTDTLGIPSLVFGVLFAMYLAAYRFFLHTFFLFFAGFFGTVFFFFGASWLADGTAIGLSYNFDAVLLLTIGTVYVLLGYFFTTQYTKAMALTPLLYAFGMLFVFAPMFSLAGYAPEQNIFWEVMIPLVAIGALFFGLPLQQHRIFLIGGSTALITYLFRITDEYFAESFGWPLALIILGLGMIGLRTVVMQLKSQYTK
jgi:hypothetical protein